MEKKRDSMFFVSDTEYATWIQELGKRYRASQIKAAIHINSELLRFYWSVGRDIVLMHIEDKWGLGVLKQVSKDLTSMLDRKGFSVTSLGYMKRFYLLYPEACKYCPQDEGKKSEIRNNPQLGGEIGNPIFCIPWSHHKAILDKVGADRLKGLFFVQKTLQNQWGRAMLENMLSSDLYEVQGQATNNFDITLPAPDADLANDLIKGSYNFGFAKISEQYNEKQLKDKLVEHIRQFLLELGRGFSFVGQEYRICAAGKEKYIDLLFYVIPIHRYCVVEVKITDFDFPDAGQLAGYMGMVDAVLTGEGDNPCIGLLICRSKNNIFAQYALSRINAPIGIAEYELSQRLPTTEEIQFALEQDS